MPGQCSGWWWAFTEGSAVAVWVRISKVEGVGFEDLVLLCLTAQVHAFKGGDLILAAGPKQDDDDVAGVLPARAVEVVENVLHGGAAEGIKHVEDEIALGKGEVLRVLVDGGEVGAAALPEAEGAEVGLGLLIQDGGEFDAEDLLEGKLRGDEQRAAFAAAEVDVGEAGRVADGNLAEGAADVVRPGGHVELAVGELLRGDAGGPERDVTGGADVAGAVEPLVLEELSGGSDDGFEVIPYVQSVLHVCGLSLTSFGDEDDWGRLFREVCAARWGDRAFLL